MSISNTKQQVEKVDEVEDKSASQMVDHPDVVRDQYLLQRHGTLELNPKPSADPEDPLNWPSWKVHPGNHSLDAPHS